MTCSTRSPRWSVRSGHVLKLEFRRKACVNQCTSIPEKRPGCTTRICRGWSLGSTRLRWVGSIMVTTSPVQYGCNPEIGNFRCLHVVTVQLTPRSSRQQMPTNILKESVIIHVDRYFPSCLAARSDLLYFATCPAILLTSRFPNPLRLSVQFFTCFTNRQCTTASSPESYMVRDKRLAVTCPISEPSHSAYDHRCLYRGLHCFGLRPAVSCDERVEAR